MKDDYLQNIVKGDFDKAYNKGLFSRIFAGLRGEADSLLSFNFVMRYVKVENEFYKGIQFVKIDDIIGSEGRYNDFNKEFLPKRKILRQRWERVDVAHYKDIILPPIQVYQLGKAYFVRDGNHRVSVARRKGQEFIDAEVVMIKSDILITPDMSKNNLIRIVVEHEKKKFLEHTHIDNFRDVSMINFSYSGRFSELVSHITGHQYFMGIEQERDVQFEEAMLSWYDTLFLPIITEIEKEKIKKRFPGRTNADLYVWIIRHWDQLKEKYGEDYSINSAVKSFNTEFGKNWFKRIKDFFNKIQDR